MENSLFYTIIAIILTTILVGLTYFFLNISLYKADVVLVAFGIIILSFYFFIMYFANKNKKANAATQKKWLLKEIILGRSSIVGMIYLPIQIMLHSEKVLENSLGVLGISFLLVSLIRQLKSQEVSQVSNNSTSENRRERFCSIPNQPLAMMKQH